MPSTATVAITPTISPRLLEPPAAGGIEVVAGAALGAPPNPDDGDAGGGADAGENAAGVMATTGRVMLATVESVEFVEYVEFAELGVAGVAGRGVTAGLAGGATAAAATGAAETTVVPQCTQNFALG